MAKATRSEATKPSRKRKRSLPDEIIPIHNKDKGFHEHWYPSRNLLDFPHPFRMILASKPNCGKTTIILNLILRVTKGKNPFQKIIVVHADPENTHEYESLDCEMLSQIPSADEFPGDRKCLVILEDIPLMDLSLSQKSRLERLYGYVSTHKNISVILTTQDIFRVLPTVRRCTNIFVIFNSHDADHVRSLARKLGIGPETLVSSLKTNCAGSHDSLWIDMTPNSPARVRLNGFQKIIL